MRTANTQTHTKKKAKENCKGELKKYSRTGYLKVLHYYSQCQVKSKILTKNVGVYCDGCVN